jgi:hypothetical protein
VKKMTKEQANDYAQRPIRDPEIERRLRVIETARGAWQMYACALPIMCVEASLKLADQFETTAEKYLKSGEV